jgi:hypothetical protein
MAPFMCVLRRFAQLLGNGVPPFVAVVCLFGCSNGGRPVPTDMIWSWVIALDNTPPETPREAVLEARVATEFGAHLPVESRPFEDMLTAKGFTCEFYTQRRLSNFEKRVTEIRKCTYIKAAPTNYSGCYPGQSVAIAITWIYQVAMDAPSLPVKEFKTHVIIGTDFDPNDHGPGWCIPL